MRIRPIPQCASEPIGIMIYSQGTLTDPDSVVISGQSVPGVFVQVIDSDNGTVIIPSGTLSNTFVVGTIS